MRTSLENSPTELKNNLQKHRGRMRERLLNNGASTLEDYEILEMIFFLGIPRGDTKSLAKATINRFGSLAVVLAAKAQQLHKSPGIEPNCVIAIEIVQEAMLRLAKAETAEKPLLNNWARLAEYIQTLVVRQQEPNFRVFFLDSRNRLLADEMQTERVLAATFPRQVIARALELNATALILVNFCEGETRQFTNEEILAVNFIREAATKLSLMVHDYLLIRSENWISLKKEGLI